ncbi:unnamed protein product, partial [marine sediment metagenome]
DDVVISAAHPIMHQELDKNAVMDQYKWKDEDYEALSIIDDEAFSRGEFTVGWYHTHPGFKVMMSHIDIRTTLSYQTNNPLAVSLVFNHMRLIKQIELPDKKGDPDIPLENDPDFNYKNLFLFFFSLEFIQYLLWIFRFVKRKTRKKMTENTCYQ